MRILAIGNSFSQDATADLQPMAAAGGLDAEVVNLFIPGCPLETHWECAQNDRPAYSLQRDGLDTGRWVSLRDALCERDWDLVTLQQASGLSGLPETYMPYMAELVGFVRALAPRARIFVHETWAYESDSDHGAFPAYHSNQNEMHIRLKEAYAAAAAALSLPLIPSGDVIQALRGTPAFCYARGGPSLCRDGFHLSLTYGRYAAAATWYETLLGGDIRRNPYLPDGDGLPVEEDLLAVVRETVHTLASR
ncbi:MAG TPA: DUF4886 domain-containing protein [Firmicutes bacterium]|nr:DUF4886 domain-containing protein [Bacillota bacterium]